jgi:hypothetical protein
VVMGRAAKGWATMGRVGTGRATMGQAGTGRVRMSQVGTGRAKMGWLDTGWSGTGRLQKKLQRTLLLLTGFMLFFCQFQAIWAPPNGPKMLDESPHVARMYCLMTKLKNESLAKFFRSILLGEMVQNN